MALVTQKDYARHRKVTPQYISKLVREGRLALSATGLIDPHKADKALGPIRGAKASGPKPKKTAQKKAAAVRPPRTSATRSLTESRAESEHYKALRSKVEYEREIGLLLPKAEVLEAERRKNANIRTRFRALARSLADRLARTTSPAACEALLLSEIDSQLAELAADPLGLKAETIAPEPFLQTSAVPPAPAAEPVGATA